MTEIPTEALQAAARAAAKAYRSWKQQHEWSVTREQAEREWLDRWLTTVSAAAPFLIAEGRRAAAQAIRDTGPNAGWSLVHREAAAAIAEGTEDG